MEVQPAGCPLSKISNRHFRHTFIGSGAYDDPQSSYGGNFMIKLSVQPAGMFAFNA